MRAVAYLLSGSLALSALALGAGACGGSEAKQSAPSVPDYKLVFIASGQIYVADADGSHRTRLTNHQAFDEPESPAWSPDAKSIVYVAGDDIYTMAPDGSYKRNLTHVPARDEVDPLEGREALGDHLPKWSPDGSMIAFPSGRNSIRYASYDPFFDDSLYGTCPRASSACKYVSSEQELYLMKPDGSDLTLVAQGLQYHQKFDWSPDGAYLAYSKNMDIYAVRRDGTGEMLLAARQAWQDELAWSPDGARVAFVSDHDRGKRIYILELSSGRVTRLLEPDNGVDASPAWSPDGSRIAFLSNRGGSRGVYVINSDGSGLRRLADMGGGASYGGLAWSPDGSRIAFDYIGRNIGWIIDIADADGSGVFRFGAGSAPAWSPVKLP